jgi:hypothetical protein
MSTICVLRGCQSAPVDVGRLDMVSTSDIAPCRKPIISFAWFVRFQSSHKYMMKVTIAIPPANQSNEFLHIVGRYSETGTRRDDKQRVQESSMVPGGILKAHTREP